MRRILFVMALCTVGCVKEPAPEGQTVRDPRPAIFGTKDQPFEIFELKANCVYLFEASSERSVAMFVVPRTEAGCR